MVDQAFAQGYGEHGRSNQPIFAKIGYDWAGFFSGVGLEKNSAL